MTYYDRSPSFGIEIRSFLRKETALSPGGQGCLTLFLGLLRLTFRLRTLPGDDMRSYGERQANAIVPSEQTPKPAKPHPFPIEG